MGKQLLYPYHSCLTLRYAVSLHVLQLSTQRSCFVHKVVFFVVQGYFFSVWNICAVFQVSRVQKHMDSMLWLQYLTLLCWLQIVALVFYLPLLAAFFNEPNKWSVQAYSQGPAVQTCQLSLLL